MRAKDIKVGMKVHAPFRMNNRGRRVATPAGNQEYTGNVLTKPVKKDGVTTVLVSGFGDPIDIDILETLQK